MFLYSHQLNESVIFDDFDFRLAAFVLFHDFSHKYT